MRILIVEDEGRIRDFLKKNLEAECYAVDTAEDGLTGEALAHTNQYDLLILDNMLPGKTGLELCAALRADGQTVPILLLSVRDETDVKVCALDAGADDYLTKPFSLAELSARVRALLRRPSAIEPEVLEYKNLRVDVKRHLAVLDEKPLTLTRKEFMLLVYLMQNSGFVLSRGMILEHVWDINADPFSNTIETHVASLRRKLGDTDTNDYIVTISGRGYRFGYGE